MGGADLSIEAFLEHEYCQDYNWSVKDIISFSAIETLKTESTLKALTTTLDRTRQLLSELRDVPVLDNYGRAPFLILLMEDLVGDDCYRQYLLNALIIRNCYGLGSAAKLVAKQRSRLRRMML